MSNRAQTLTPTCVGRVVCIASVRIVMGFVALRVWNE
jgi:hypothetical protein